MIFSVDNGVGRNVIIFGVDVSSTPRIDNKEKDILRSYTRIRTYTGCRKTVFN